ncbi:MAG TPA: hypothetical protein VM933_05140 [Acidimicrobiales bacterium]|nr:hypothetical protein [Acidimicrobiales bacterium]
MGQPITVVRKPSSKPDLARFEINRTLTGTGHERYLAGGEISGDRPPDELARRLIAAGGVRGVHIHSNIITVELEPGAGAKADGFEDVIRELYIHYRPGVVPSF